MLSWSIFHVGTEVCNHLFSESLVSNKKNILTDIYYRQIIARWPYTRFLHHTFSFLGDSLAYINGAYFSTNDVDNDTSGGSCAQADTTGWWLKHCSYSNLNGSYSKGGSGKEKHLVWYHWGNKWLSLKSSVMMIRPKPGAWNAEVILNSWIKPNQKHFCFVFHVFSLFPSFSMYMLFMLISASR